MRCDASKGSGETELLVTKLNTGLVESIIQTRASYAIKMLEAGPGESDRPTGSSEFR